VVALGVGFQGQVKAALVGKKELLRDPLVVKVAVVIVIVGFVCK